MIDIFLPIFLLVVLLWVVIIGHLLRSKWPAAPYIALPVAIVLIFLLAMLCAAVWAIVTFFLGVFYSTLVGILWYINPRKVQRAYKRKKRRYKTKSKSKN